jgi:hypothetical protein
MFFIEEPYFTELLRSTRGDVERLPEIVLQPFVEAVHGVVQWLRGASARQPDSRPSFPSQP